LVVQDLSDDRSGEDIAAIKLGDVNGSISDNARKTNNPLELQVEDQSYSAGELITVEISAQGVDLSAIQLALSTKDLAYSHAEETAYYTNEQKGRLDILSTSGDLHKHVNTLTLEFVPESDGLLSEVLSIDDNGTSIAYDQTGRAYDINLVFLSERPDHATLYQNVPNPFKDATSVNFYIPESGTVSLEFFDVAGRLLKSVEAEYEAGAHEVLITRRDLNAAGVIHYKMIHKEQVQTRRMILLD